MKRKALVAALLAALLGVGWATRRSWLPSLAGWVKPPVALRTHGALWMGHRWSGKAPRGGTAPPSSE